jgi:hypothetical protein
MTAKELAALDAAALHEPAPRASIEPARVVLTPQQIAAISAEARRLDTRAQILAATEFDRDMSAKVVLIAPPIDRFRPELEASLQLAIDAALAICRLHLERKTSAHWRKEAANASAKLDDESKALDEIRRIGRIADDASRALLDAPAESRLVRLGEVVAASHHSKTGSSRRIGVTSS